MDSRSIISASNSIYSLDKTIKKAVNLLISTETERLNKLKKLVPDLEETWGKIKIYIYKGGGR